MCGRDHVPPWLLDVHGCVIFPGSIIRCSHGAASFISPPALVSIAGPSPRGRSVSSRSPSRNVPPSSPTQSHGAVATSPRQMVGGRSGMSNQNASPSTTSRRKDRIQQASFNQGINAWESNRGERSSGSESQRSNRDVRPGETKSGDQSKAIARRVYPSFEEATAVMKAKFDACPGDRTVMVAAIHGLRPPPPYPERSLEGYCVLVSI